MKSYKKQFREFFEDLSNRYKITRGANCVDTCNHCYTIIDKNNVIEFHDMRWEKHRIALVIFGNYHKMFYLRQTTVERIKEYILVKLKDRKLSTWWDTVKNKKRDKLICPSYEIL